MRFFIKEQITALNKELKDRKDKYNGFKQFNFNDNQMLNVIEKMLFDNQDIYEEFFDGYKIEKETKYPLGELIKKLHDSDFSNFFYTLIYYVSFKTNHTRRTYA